jgi:uncharacterized membrane protein YqhA
MRKSTIFFAAAILAISLFFLMAMHAIWRQQDDQEALRAKRLMVRALQLTDISLFTDARYVRHLSQTDLHTPFQEHPSALEHFPSGSLVSPPSILRKSYEKLD